MSAEWKSVFQQRINELYQRAKDRDYKLTQEGYATRLGTSRNSLRGWLAGTGQPDADGFARISRIENVSLDWLMGNEEQPGYYDDPEVAAIAQEMHDNPDIKVLFHATKGMKKESIEEIRKFVEFQKAKENGFME